LRFRAILYSIHQVASDEFLPTELLFPIFFFLFPFFFCLFPISGFRPPFPACPVGPEDRTGVEPGLPRVIRSRQRSSFHWGSLTGCSTGVTSDPYLLNSDACSFLLISPTPLPNIPTAYVLSFEFSASCGYPSKLHRRVQYIPFFFKIIITLLIFWNIFLILLKTKYLVCQGKYTTIYWDIYWSVNIRLNSEEI